MKIHAFLFAVIALLSEYTVAQSDSVRKQGFSNFPSTVFSRISKKAKNLGDNITYQSNQTINRISKKEDELRIELYKFDSSKAQYLYLGDPKSRYRDISKAINDDSSKVAKPSGVMYLPYADSLQGMAAFFKTNPELNTFNKTLNPGNITSSLNNLQVLQGKMQHADFARQYILERKNQIKQFIASNSHLPATVSKIYNDYNKELYYYTQQLNACKEMLNDPDKVAKKALSVLNKIPAFAAFMKKNSFLSRLFDVPEGYDMQSSLSGMQTKDLVSDIIKTQVTSGGGDAANALIQNLQGVNEQFRSLKDRIKNLGDGAANVDLPENFKPNNQRAKTFLQRLEFGFNIQNAPSTGIIPTTTDFGLSVGYKLNNGTTAGIGGSYNIGWGSGLSHIKLSSQGASVRSFVDVKIKGGIYASGGFEYTGQMINTSVSQSGLHKIWQKSGLIGLSKILSTGSKYVKNTKVQLFWNFLSYQQRPITQPIVFRIGYTL